MVCLAKPQIIVHAFVLSCLDYCNSLFTDSDKSCFGGPQTGTKHCSQTINIYNIYNIIFIIYLLFYFISLPVDFKICFKILVLRYRALNGQDPQYLYKLCTKQTSQYSITGSEFVSCFVYKIKNQGNRQPVAPNLPFCIAITALDFLVYFTLSCCTALCDCLSVKVLYK